MALIGIRRALIKPKIIAVASAPFALDGTPVTANSSSANLVLPSLTTSFANDVICVALITQGTAITSVTASGLTFTREPSLTPPTNGTNTCDLWYAVAAAAGSFVITINNSAAYTVAIAFGISGAKTSAPFDVNAAIPATSTSGSNATITTTAANTMAFGWTASNSSTPGSGFALMSAAAQTAFMALSYKFVSTTQSATIFDSHAGPPTIATAIVKGP